MTNRQKIITMLILETKIFGVREKRYKHKIKELKVL